jgi:hypothetical protein
MKIYFIRGWNEKHEHNIKNDKIFESNAIIVTITLKTRLAMKT